MKACKTSDVTTLPFTVCSLCYAAHLAMPDFSLTKNVSFTFPLTSSCVISQLHQFFIFSFALFIEAVASELYCSDC